MTEGVHLTAKTPTLDIAYEAHGPAAGRPVVLMHGFPYDVRTYDVAARRLAAAGLRVIVPYLRGFGPTRFLDPATLRSGEQAALGHDLLDLIDALGLDRPVVAGYDWGGRAACIVSALWPDRVSGLVTGGGYNMFAKFDPTLVLPPAMEHVLWYQYYLHRPDAHERLAAMRADFCRYLWTIWSPEWRFDEACFQATAGSFDNPDFVDVVVHSYRHRFSLVAGDPDLAEIDRLASERPAIRVPTVVLYGDSGPAASMLRHDPSRFAGPCRVLSLPHVGHNFPQEAPGALVAAVLSLAG